MSHLWPDLVKIAALAFIFFLGFLWGWFRRGEFEKKGRRGGMIHD